MIKDMLKKIALCLICLVLLLSACSCVLDSLCDGHVDSDDDSVCDNCGEEYSDGVVVVINAARLLYISNYYGKTE